jgi:hypothetical protein
LTIGDRVGASSYPAQGAGDALGERAAATSWRTRPERSADAEIVGQTPQSPSAMLQELSMHSIQKDMEEFQGQLGKGSIQTAYRALLSYMMGLRTHFKNSYAGSVVSGLYQGYMDMTYFAIFPPSLKQRDLKIAIVFNYEAFRFEGWLAGSNRQVQQKYWELVKKSHWNEYRVVAPAKGVDSIIECDLAEDFDFDDLDSLTASIEENTAEFIDHIESFLSEHDVV